MPKRFEYKPRFVDIRVRPPRDEKADKPAKRGDTKCDHPGCDNKATSPAPKSPHLIDSPDRFWFCFAHASDYNKRWDFFSGMDELQVAKFHEDALTGHRPTWEMRASRNARENINGHIRGPFGATFDDKVGKDTPRAAPTRTLGRLEQKALEDMNLHEGATSEEIRMRYTELLKRYHPDANGGDRSTEGRLHIVIKAYKILKASGLAKPKDTR